MNKIELEIVALSHSITQSHSYAIVLGEKPSGRRLPIVIGGFEAQAIAVAIEKMTPSRPLTHDLLKSFSDTFNINIKEIIIDNLVDGVFYAKLICVGHNGKEVEIDSRTSDALALAVRFNCPIYTYEFILDSAGIILEEGGEKEKKQTKKAQSPKESGKTSAKTPSKQLQTKTGDITKMTIKQLNDTIDDLLANEKYEEAVKYRDEINRRKQNS